MYRLEDVPDKVVNKQLYLRVKREIYDNIPKHSAYRSGMIMKTYKYRGGKVKETGDGKNLSRWFKEKWVNLTPYGEGLVNNKLVYACGERHPDQKGPSVCRPSVKIDSKKTPIVAQKFDRAQIKKAVKIKANKKRIVWSEL